MTMAAPTPAVAPTNGSVVIPENLPDPYRSLQEENPNNWVPILEQPLATPRKLKLICIGAGFSGMTVAYKIKHEKKLMDIIDLVIYDKNNDVGGTWFDNIYPGVACDIPVHAYSFPFNPNPYFSKTYCSGAEIENYIKKTADDFDLRPFMKFNAEIIETIWNEETGKWIVKVKQGEVTIEDEADVLVNGSGILNEPVWPKVPGLAEYQGKLLHSARWDANYDPKDKRIAVIGNGSSGIQLVTALQPVASKIVNYIRSPTWISPPIASNVTYGQNLPYSEEQQKQWAENPGEFLEYRKKLDSAVNSVYHLSVANNPLNQMISGFTKGVMQDRLKNSPELAKKLIPDFPVGCRRLTPGEGYLEALQEPNAQCEFQPITRFTETGIEVEGGEIQEFDLIVCATGFDTTFGPRWKLVGRSKPETEGATGSPEPKAYFGLAYSHLPNYFQFNGPNGANGHGSEMQHKMWSTDYILKWCKKLAQEDIKSFCVREDAIEDFYVYCQELLKRTVWSGHCRSWYTSGRKEGRVTALYGGSILHWKEMIDTIRGEDFDIRYQSKNRFRFMGNGFTNLEVTGGDMAYYLTK